MTKVTIKAADGTGSVDLYHDSTKKISTYASGAQVNSTNLQFTEAGTAYIDKLSNGSGLVFRASTSSDADTQVCTVHGGPGGVGALDLPDNTRLRFGTGNDLALYYDSSNTYFDQTDNTGNMNFRTNSKILFKSVGSSETIAKFIKDGTCELYYDNSKKIETIATGVNVTGGIRLGGNNAANELDDYEEGTWTPTLNASGISVSYTTQAGKYTKVGNIVHASFVCRVSSHSGGSGQYTIAGLPFTSDTPGDDHIGISTAAWEKLSLGASEQHIQVMDDNSTSVRLLKQSNSSGWASFAPDSDCSIYMSFSYPTA